MLNARQRVLVIDDEEPYYTVVRDLLPTEEFDVAWVQTKEAAIEHMEKRAVDLIVLDLKLSDRSDDESGIELLRELRARWPRIQVIVFTRYYMQAEKVVECMKAGAYYYFIKNQFSAEPARFNTLVREALSYRPKHDVFEDYYPHPIALVYRDYRRNVVAPYLKFRRMIELVELLVKFSTITCLSAIHNQENIIGPPGGGLLKPSLGKWFEFLQSVLASQEVKLMWIEHIRKIFTLPHRRAISGLIQIRNEWGHGATRSDHEYSSIVRQWDGAVLELLSAASIFAVWQLFVVKSTRLFADVGRLHTVVNIKGHNPKFLREEILLPKDCEAEKVYAFDSDAGQLLSFDPFVAVFICEQCNQETVFVYDKADKDRVLYLDYANGHHSAKVEPYRRIKGLLG